MPRWIFSILGGVCLLLVAWLLWWYVQRQRVAPPAPRVVPRAVNLDELVRLETRGIALLENGQAAAGADVFTELARLVPDDPGPVRNVAIGRLLTLQGLSRQVDPVAFDAAAAAAESAQQALERLAPDDVVTQRLRARLAAALGDKPRELAALERAAQVSPDDASLWYELYQAAQFAGGAEAASLSMQAIDRAADLAPTNLFVLLDWLLAHLNGDPETLVARLDQTRPLWESLVPGVQQRVRIDLQELLDRIRTAAAAGDRPGVQRAVRMLVNVARPDDVAQSDRLRVDRHVLEFVALELAGEAQARASAVATSGAMTSWSVRWTDVTAESRLPEWTDVLNVAWADIDLDQRPDLVVLRTGQVEVYRRGEGDEPWVQLMAQSLPAGMTQMLLGDFDQDADEGLRLDSARGAAGAQAHCHVADLDLFVYGPGGAALFLNELDPATGGRTLRPVETPFAGQSDGGFLACDVADLNSDGDLDWLTVSPVAASWWGNEGGAVVARRDFGAALPDGVRQLIPIDWDRDVDCDVLVLTEAGAVGLLENLRHGTFRWLPWDETARFPAGLQRGLVLEADGNQSWDLVCTGGGGTSLLTTRTIVPGSVQRLGVKPLEPEPARGILDSDFDNDGLRDLVLWGDDRLRLLRGLPQGDFQRLTGDEELPQPAGPVLAAECADIDHDGDIDLLVVAGGRLQLFRNEVPTSAGWLDVALVAQQVKGEQSASSGRVNHYGLGSLIEIRDGLRYQAQVVRSPWTHFGIATGHPDDLRIVWTNGVPDNLLSPAPRTTICERQSLKGSCPYLYAWNGERFEFVTDLLWAAPIGLVAADGQLVPCREWEYLKVPGAAVSPVEGEYRLAITEELWEAAYFDHVELLAVDHPVDAEVYSNEKVGPPALAEFHAHAVRQRQTPVSVRDRYGHDLLPLVRQADELYARPFRSKLRQGLTEPSWLEIDLGLMERPARLRLFLTGWIYPTDTTINAALQEDTRLEGPRPPSIALPNAAGEFETVVPYMGFPGGKTKTIVVDLTDVWRAGNSRLRIETSQELYWDEIFFSTEAEDLPVRIQPVELLSADLRYRGISAAIPHPQEGPERYDYQQSDPRPKWPAMRGRFTRYGDVLELLAAADDLSVVMGSGDELQLRFRALPPLPPGWSRDFLLHSIGWDKDADLHTVYGATVEPLPFREMAGYPYAPVQEFPDSPRHREYLQRYQTREPSLRQPLDRLLGPVR